MQHTDILGGILNPTLNRTVLAMYALKNSKWLYGDTVPIRSPKDDYNLPRKMRNNYHPTYMDAFTLRWHTLSYHPYNCLPDQRYLDVMCLHEDLVEGKGVHGTTQEVGNREQLLIVYVACEQKPSFAFNSACLVIWISLNVSWFIFTVIHYVVLLRGNLR